MIKLKSGFILREVNGDTVVVSSGDEVNFNGMITLNETGKTIWCALEKGTTFEELVKNLLDEYDVSEERATLQAEKFIEQLKGLDFLE